MPIKQISTSKTSNHMFKREIWDKFNEFPKFYE